MTKIEDEEQAAFPDPVKLTAERYILCLISGGTARTAWC